MDFINNKKHTKKYFNEIVNKSDKTAFEEKYIKLYKTEDVSEFEKALYDSKYSIATDSYVAINHADIEIGFIYDELEFFIELNDSEAIVSIYDDTELILDDDYQKIHKINFNYSIYEILSMVFDKLDDELNEFKNEDRREALLNDIFNIKKIEKNGKKYLRNNLFICFFFSIAVLTLLISLFLYFDLDEKSYVELLFILIICVIFGIEIYSCCNKYVKISKFIKKIDKNDGLNKVYGTPSKVVFYFTSIRSGKQLDYLVITIDNKNYLACLPKPIFLNKEERNMLVNKLHEKSYSLYYYENSKIIDLKNSKLYEDIMKIHYR